MPTACKNTTTTQVIAENLTGIIADLQESLTYQREAAVENWKDYDAEPHKVIETLKGTRFYIREAVEKLNELEKIALKLSKDPIYSTTKL